MREAYGAMTGGGGLLTDDVEEILLVSAAGAWAGGAAATGAGSASAVCNILVAIGDDSGSAAGVSSLGWVSALA